MPVRRCPFPDCTFVTEDVSDNLASTTLEIHARIHTVPAATAAPAPTPTHRTEKVKRPSITAAGTGEDWAYFLARWEEYKAATGVTGRELVLQLLECCDEELRKDLTRNAGGSLADSSEAVVLAAIKLLAVRQENIMVARNELWNMHQDHDEPVRRFGARLRGQAGMCNLAQECSSNTCTQMNSFMDQILRDVLIRGIADYDIRLAILQDKNQDMTLEEAFQFIEAKETGKKSASQMKDADELAAARSSSYRRQMKSTRDKPLSNSTNTSGNNNDNSAQHGLPCGYCGQSGHGSRSSPEVRSSKCSAYNTSCTFCGTLHHFESCCKKKAKAAVKQNTSANTIGTDVPLTVLDHSQQLCAVADVDPPIMTSVNSAGYNGSPVSSPLPVDEAAAVTEIIEIIEIVEIIEIIQPPSASAASPPSQIIHESSMGQRDPTSPLTAAAPPPVTVLDGSSSSPHNAISSTAQTGSPASVCTSQSTPAQGDNVGALDHHVYDPSRHVWVKKPSSPQPFLNLELSVHPEDYDALKLPRMVPKIRSASIRVLADTGFQSMLISFKILRKLGIYEKHLIPASMRMHTATYGLIDIIGCVVMRLSGVSPDGTQHETRQIVYVTGTANRLFLSMEACIALGLISPSFPTVGEALPSNTAATIASQQLPCGHNKRTGPPPKPTELPFPATKENRLRLEKFLLDYYADCVCNTCTHQPMPKMNTEPMRIMIDPFATPVARTKILPVPLHQQDEVKEGIDGDVRMDNLEPVPPGEPITWFHQMVLAEKKDGKVRRTVDFQPLNKHAIREKHHTQSPFHLARSIPKQTLKTTFDNWNSFHALPLHSADRHYTTFGTPWGVYRYKVAPQGYAFTGDAYTKRFDAIVAHIPRKVQCIDDSCLWDSDMETAFFHAVDWFDACARNGVTVNPEKFVFASETVEFAGFEITPTTVRPCKKSLEAILSFPTPQNITDMRSWFGLLNQVAYAFSVAEHMQPFRHLLKPGTLFQWTPELDKLFEESKLAIVREIEEGVRIFDMSKPTCLATDWSKTGIGFWLYQKHCSCESTQPRCCPTGWKVSMVGSRFTQHSESNYAPVEGEALAVAYALEKAKFFVLGCDDLTVAVDHKPLLGIFSDRSLDMANDRLRNLKEKTLRFRFKMIHVPGMKNKAADTLSQHPSDSSDTRVPVDIVACLQECPAPKAL